MTIAVGSDESSALTEALLAKLRARGIAVRTFGALAEGAQRLWSLVGRAVGEAVANGECEMGVLLCWTGTGVSIAANKVPGVRAALCVDAATAAGARRWNDANVLCLSLRSTASPVMEEILDAWLSTDASDGEREIEAIEALEPSK